jgi:hypothetical protein
MAPLIAQSPAPIIVKLVEPSKHSNRYVEVLLGALGLTGALTLLALVCGAVLAVVIFWLRGRER